MYIITGATGFIGSNLLAEMELRGYNDLVAVDSFGSEDKWKNVAKRGAVTFVLPDQLNAFLGKHKDSVKGVLHLGAISSTTERDVDKILVNNFQLTTGLYRFCRDNGIPLIYASSAATYGDGSNGFVDRDDLKYLSALRPLNPYGWSKNAVDKYIAADRLHNGNSNQVVGLKFFNVYGPNEYHKGDMMSVVRKFYDQFRSVGFVRLFKSHRPDFADGEQLRDFVWVGDCVDVMLWMLEHNDVSGLFNVGTGKATSYNTVVRSVAQSMGVDAKIDYFDMPDGVRNQYQYFTEADLSKLRSVGYHNPMTNVPDGVKTYVGSYLSKPDIYR